VIDRLLASEPEVAACIVATSPVLTRDELTGLASEAGATAVALAGRSGLEADLGHALVRQGDPAVIDALVANHSAQFNRETVALIASAGRAGPGGRDER